MPSSSYKLVVRLFLTERFDLTTRAILDTGSGPTLISRQLLPDDTQLQPLGEWASMRYLSEEAVPARGTRSCQSARYVRAPKGVQLS